MGRPKVGKVGPPSVLTEEEDEAIVAWVLNMQKCGLFIIL
jgi:hypothetical protein